MKFVLFQKLAGLQGGGLVMFLLSVIAVAALLIGIIRYKKTSHPAPKNRTRALVYGALCVALSFMLSYIKLFSLPMGGSLTLCSMLPIAVLPSMFALSRFMSESRASTLVISSIARISEVLPSRMRVRFSR